MCCLGFSRFFFSDTFELLHQSEKHDEKERLFFFFFFFKCLVILLQENKRKKKENLSRKKKPVGGAFNKRKRRDFETTRFSFSFLLRTRREKKIHSRQKESFHLLQKRARALKEHRHTRAHKTQREREKKTTLFSSSLIELFVYFVFVLFARTTEREKERRHFIISPLIKERRRH